MNINYRHSDWAWDNVGNYLQNTIQKNKLHRIGDIGGGAKPALEIDFINSQGLDYHVFDVDQNELDKADPQYQKRIFDISQDSISVNEEPFDFIFSIMTMEHIKNVPRFHQNIYDSLNEGGYAFHYFPCITSIPMLLNKYIPDNFTENLLYWLQPHRNKVVGKKFPAYYEWCYGPTATNLQRFQSTGFHIEEYIGFFGHHYYDRLPVFKQAEAFKTNQLLKQPNPHLAIAAFVLLKK